MLEMLSIASREVGLKINWSKMTFMTNLVAHQNILMSDVDIEQVAEFGKKSKKLLY